MAIKYVYQHLPFQDHPKFTQIVIFGLKTNYLATQPSFGQIFVRQIQL
jgi:predicted histidine transporter YuiF (NhaC family)